MPGPWRVEVTPQVKHWQNLISARRLGRAFMGQRDQYAHLTEQVWFIAGTQSAKTRSVLYASLGYCVDQHPSPKGLVLPRLKDFKKVLDNRVKPFFQETPALARHFPERKSAMARQITYGQWLMDNCTVYMLCGELADDLRSFPMCELFLDEFDLLPIDCEGQGDPIQLVMDRQKTWPRTKLTVGVTTPTTVDGHGWRRLCSGSHERLLIRCPACGADQELHPDQLRWPKEATPDEIKMRSLATWQCAHCPHALKDDGSKDDLVTAACALDHWVPGSWKIDEVHTTGHWTPRADFDERHQLIRITPCETVVRSGHMNSLYSRFVSLSEFASNECRAKQTGNAAEWIAHVNGWRCEPYIPQLIASVDMAELGKNATSYGYAMGQVPRGALRLALVCDQQGNSRASSWFPYEVRAYGDLGETWLIHAGKAESWEELDQLENRLWPIGGEPRVVDITAMDGNNGTMRVPVQAWSAAKPQRRIVLNGRFWPDFLWRQRAEGTKREDRNKRIVKNARVFNFHSNAYKTELDARMRWAKGSKKWNLPDDAPDFYLKSLTAEEQTLQPVKLPECASKKMVLVWNPRQVRNQQGQITVRTDNHWFDTATMALVVGDIMGWDNLGSKPKAPPKKYGLVGSA